MVSWGWIVIAFFAGAAGGMFLLAFAEVSRREDERSDRDGRRE